MTFLLETQIDFVFGAIVYRDRQKGKKAIAKLYIPLKEVNEVDHILFPKVKKVTPLEAILFNRKSLRKTVKKLRD